MSVSDLTNHDPETCILCGAAIPSGTGFGVRDDEALRDVVPDLPPPTLLDAWFCEGPCTAKVIAGEMERRDRAIVHLSPGLAIVSTKDGSSVTVYGSKP